MNIIGFMLFFFPGALVADPNFYTNSAKILSFAENLEAEGDWYRAITEYKRYVHLEGEPQDDIHYRISRLYTKLKRFGNALDALLVIENKENGRYCYSVGQVYFLAGDYTNAKAYWRSDTLLGWIHLREGNYQQASQLLNITHYPTRKKPWLGGALSALIPGSGRVYAGRAADGISAFALTLGTGLSSYYCFKQERYAPAYLFALLCAGFYLGDIYGSVISVRQYNEIQEEKYVSEIEITLGLRRQLW